jgi:hypothetical protein
MSFTVGLAVFAAALATGLGSYIRAAVSEEQSIRERILLESAAVTVLGELASGGAVRVHGAREIDGRPVEVSVTPTSMRIDLATDDAESVRAGGAKLGLAIDPNIARAAPGLATLSAGMNLDASEEDCLRQAFTYGRGGQARSDTAALPDAFNVQSGDQVDVRVSTTGHAPTVLWVRARFTDDRSGWALHDYRRLRPTKPCKVWGPLGTDVQHSAR